MAARWRCSTRRASASAGDAGGMGAAANALVNTRALRSSTRGAIIARASIMPTRLALAAVLVLAGVLRFTALSWGLRHVPHLDEQYFVENVRGMLARGDLDHRFHEYPGLMFYLLLPLEAAVDRTTLARRGYLVARALVAAFGVASVGAVYRLWRTMSGAAARPSAA